MRPTTSRRPVARSAPAPETSLPALSAPKKGDVAAKDCHDHPPTFLATGEGCVAKEDAVYEIVIGQTWGCVFPTVGRDSKKVAPAQPECVTWPFDGVDLVDFETEPNITGARRLTEADEIVIKEEWFTQNVPVKDLTACNRPTPPSPSSTPVPTTQVPTPAPTPVPTTESPTTLTPMKPALTTPVPTTQKPTTPAPTKTAPTTAKPIPTPCSPIVKPAPTTQKPTVPGYHPASTTPAPTNTTVWPSPGGSTPAPTSRKPTSETTNASVRSNADMSTEPSGFGGSWVFVAIVASAFLAVGSAVYCRRDKSPAFSHGPVLSPA